MPCIITMHVKSNHEHLHKQMETVRMSHSVLHMEFWIILGFWKIAADNEMGITHKGIIDLFLTSC